MIAAQLPLSFSISISVPTPPLLTNPRSLHLFRHRSIGSHICAGKRWDSSTEPSSNGKFRPDWDDELEYGSRGGRKQRVWWSDVDDDDDEFDLDDDDEFWGFKVFFLT